MSISRRALFATVAALPAALLGLKARPASTIDVLSKHLEPIRPVVERTLAAQGLFGPLNDATTTNYYRGVHRAARPAGEIKRRALLGDWPTVAEEQLKGL